MIRIRIARTYTFQSAHRLPHVLEGHKCGRLHGHTYLLTVEIEGTREKTLEWVMDFAMLDSIVQSVIVAVLDHRYLNEIEGLENPTSENIAWWIWQRLSVYNWPHSIALERVVVAENDRSEVTIRADT